MLLSSLVLILCVLPAPATEAATHANVPLNAPVEEADEFHFVVLGDAQFDDAATFNRIVDQSRRLRPAFVIQVGDLIEGYNNDLGAIAREWQRFAQQIQPLAPVPYLPVPGNHDLYNGNKQPDARLEQMFEQQWGPLYFAFQYKNALLIGLNSDASSGANRITGKQWRWLQSTLADNDAEHKFVFMHRPPLLMKNGDALHKLFAKHGVSHVFYGHHHHYHHLLKDGIHYSMTNATGASIQDIPEVGGFQHLIQVSVRGAEVDVAVIQADAIKAQDAVYPQDNYDLFDLQRKLVPAQVKLQPHDPSADAHSSFKFDIPLHNASRRDVQLFISCDSADQRWAFDPTVIAPLTLAAGSRSSLALTARFQHNRVPETPPRCQVRLPLQTRHGVWVDINLQVLGQF